MDRDEITNLVLKELHGRLWHTTPPDRFARILELGAILPVHPDNPNPDGWKTLSGAPYRSYAHTLGAVSLFDFDQLDPEVYRENATSSSWDEYVPFREKWGSAVWIELDREKVTPQLISAAELLKTKPRGGSSEVLDHALHRSGARRTTAAIRVRESLRCRKGRQWNPRTQSVTSFASSPVRAPKKMRDG